MSSRRRHIAVHLGRGRAAAGREQREDERNPGPLQRFQAQAQAHRLPLGTSNSLAPLLRAWSKFKELGPPAARARAPRTDDARAFPHAPDNPEFARVIELRQLRDLDAFDFDIAPDPREAEALARLLDARSVRKMRFAGRLTPLADGGWQLAGALGATVVQSCVVTLDPVTTRIDQPVRRTFLPETAALGARDPRRPRGGRRDRAAHRPHRPRPAWRSRRWRWRCPPIRASPAPPSGPETRRRPDESEPKPFAALAALRGKLGDES